MPPFLTEGFETGTVGMGPPGWHTFLAYNVDTANPNGTALALVDSTRAHSGTKSLHVHGGSSPGEITRALASGTNKLYVRAWIYLTRQLGQNTGTNHDHLIALRKTPGSASDEVRFGEVLGGQSKGVLGTNDALSDDFSPKLAMPTTTMVAPNRWTCFEVAFLGDQAQNALYAWVDGTLVHSITSTPAQWEHGSLSANWLSGKFGEAVLGWHSLSNVDTDLWIDDIALSNSMIGCN
jgi:hypothetical protein